MTAAPATAAGSPRPRVLVLTSTFPRQAGDSTPAFVLGLCRELALDYEVHVLAPHAPGARRRETLDGVQVHRFRYLPEAWQQLAYDGGITARLRRNPVLALQVPFFLAALCLSALCLARTLRPRLIHAHWLLPQGPAALLAARCCRPRPPVLCTLHGTDVHGWNYPPLRYLKRRLLRAMTRITAVSVSLRDAAMAAGADPRCTEVAPMGVDVDGVFHVGGESARVPGTVVFAGRLVPGKGVEILLRAWSGVPVTTGTMLTIIGDGPARASLEALAREPGLSGRVRFTGALPAAGVAEQFRAAAAAVFPFTGSEGLGLVVAEAQACGCPVIVTDIPAMGELVTPEITGIVTPAGDQAALRGAMVTLLSDRAHAGALAQAARRGVERRFDEKSVGARYREILRQMLV